MELILVEDRSTDNSYTICKAYSESKTNVHLFSTSRGGVSEARNIGIKNALGKYIAFVDADDYVKEDYLQTMYLLAEENSLEVIGSGYIAQNNGIESERHFVESFTVFKHESIQTKLRYLIFSDTEGLASVWNKFYLRAFLIEHEILFDERLTFAEDWLFNVMVLQYCNKIAFIREAFYIYVIYPKSLSNSFRDDDFYNSIFINETLSKWYPDIYAKYNKNSDIVKNQYKSIVKCARNSGIRRLMTHCDWLYSNEQIKNSCRATEANDFLSAALVKQNWIGNIEYKVVAIGYSIIPLFKHFVKAYILKTA